MRMWKRADIKKGFVHAHLPLFVLARSGLSREMRRHLRRFFWIEPIISVSVLASDNNPCYRYLFPAVGRSRCHCFSLCELNRTVKQNTMYSVGHLMATTYFTFSCLHLCFNCVNLLAHRGDKMLRILQCDYGILAFMLHIVFQATTIKSVLLSQYGLTPRKDLAPH